MAGPKGIDQWDVQSVSFAAKGHRTLRILYTTSIGGLASKPVVLAATEYILHTGGTWSGPIGSVVVDIKFTPQSELVPPFKVLYGAPNTMGDQAFANHPAKPGGVIVVGPCAPVAMGDTLRFSIKNLKPTEKDDIVVLFRYPPKELAKIMKPGATTPVVPKD